MTINPKAFLRRCFACNKDYRDHLGSSLRRGIWRCASCTAGGKVNTLCKAAKHMLEVADVNQYAVAAQAPHSDVMAYNAAVNKLRTALKQEEEASAWLVERKEHWRKEREKAQATKDQDPELSAALGWPGGISDPVLDRTRLLQMVAALCAASKQALEALQKIYIAPEHEEYIRVWWPACRDAIDALRAALAQQAEPVQMHPSQFAELIKGKETMIGVPVYWSEWPSKEKQ